MLNIGDNFNYQGRKPNFARDCFNTKQEMKNYPEQGIDTGHISFCLEDLKLYQFQAGNEVNPETGKWRKLIDSILDANSENPVENKVITSKLLEVEKLIGTKATALGKDFELSLDNMGAVIAAALVDLNKNIDELDCDNETNSCEYSIKEPLENILNKENLQSKLTSDTFIYGINYFKFKVFIESQKKNQKTEFIIDQVGIRYIKSGLELNWIPM